MGQAYLIAFGNSKLRLKKAQEEFTRLKPGFTSRSDPDLQIIEAVPIAVEKIRALKHFLGLKPYGSPPKTVIILEAQNLTPQAQINLANLLDMPDSLFILTTPNPEIFPASFMENFQLIKLPVESEIKLERQGKATLEEKLRKLATASPGEKIKEAEEIISREEAILFCQNLEVLIREKLLEALEKRKDPKTTFEMIKKIQKTLKMLSSNVNHRLAIENLFLELYSGQ